MRRRQLWVILALAAVTSLTITSAVHASPDDPVSATDIVQYGWNIKDWNHFGDPLSSWLW